MPPTTSSTIATLMRDPQPRLAASIDLQAVDERER